jgi:hypothetical protein
VLAERCVCEVVPPLAVGSSATLREWGNQVNDPGVPQVPSTEKADSRLTVRAATVNEVNYQIGQWPAAGFVIFRTGRRCAWVSPNETLLSGVSRLVRSTGGKGRKRHNQTASHRGCRAGVRMWALVAEQLPRARPESTPHSWLKHGGSASCRSPSLCWCCSWGGARSIDAPKNLSVVGLRDSTS